jgi:hypothetical protein
MEWYIQSVERKKLSNKNNRQSFWKERKMTLPNKLQEFITTGPAFQEMLRGTLQVEIWVSNNTNTNESTNKSNIVKTGHTKGKSHMREGWWKRKLRRWIWLMYFLYKNEYRIFLNCWNHHKKGTKKEKEESGWTNSGYNTYIHGNVKRKHFI